jgi:hypothetical protein
MQRDILAAVDALSATRQARQKMRRHGWCLWRQALQDAVRQRRGGGVGFADSFSRALRGLVTRGLLVGVTSWDGDLDTPGMHVFFVRRP